LWSSKSKQNLSTIAVTPSGYDDIGQVLRHLDYVPDEIEISDLDRVDSLKKYKTVFVNCSAEIVSANASAINSFVQAGGTLYASDFASHPIERNFSNFKGAFSASPFVGRMTTYVSDLGLKELIGASIHLNFDLGSWRYLSFVYQDIRVYIQGRKKGGTSYPLLFSFRYGAGTVIFTSFHNHAQVTEKERQLLEFLALRPVLSRVADESTTVLQATKLLPQVEFVDKIRQGEWSSLRGFDLYLGEYAKLLLNWEGQAKVEMMILRPDGSVHTMVRGEKPPLKVDVAGPMGKWSYRVRAIQISLPVLAYIVTVGKAGFTKCPFCGYRLRTEAKFCNSCGRPVR